MTTGRVQAHPPHVARRGLFHFLSSLGGHGGTEPLNSDIRLPILTPRDFEENAISWDRSSPLGYLDRLRFRYMTQALRAHQVGTRK